MIQNHYNKPTDTPLRDAIIKAIRESKHEYWDRHIFSELYIHEPIPPQPQSFLFTLDSLWNKQYNEQCQKDCPFTFLYTQEIRDMLKKPKFCNHPAKFNVLEALKEWDSSFPMHYKDFWDFSFHVRCKDQDRENAWKLWEDIRTEKEERFAVTHDMKLDKKTISSMIKSELTNNLEAQTALNTELQERVFLNSLTRVDFEIFLNWADYRYRFTYDHNKILQAKNIMMKAWEAMEKTYKDGQQANIAQTAYETAEEVKLHMEACTSQEPVQQPVQAVATQPLTQQSRIYIPSLSLQQPPAPVQVEPEPPLDENLLNPQIKLLIEKIERALAELTRPKLG